jgi:2-amino-4-hydroxy-6-hydroxymethyldihydropteridine diphosphokinase
MGPGAVRAFIGLGSNLADPATQVREALGELSVLPETRLVTSSPLYRSHPLGPADQPDYVNAVAEVETRLAPLALLDALQAIEARHGRVRGPLQWGPRTLDLDLLLFGDATLAEPRLRVPHPGLTTRPFVLVPLADIAPGLRLPSGAAVADLAAACDRDGLAPLAGGDRGAEMVS